MTAETVLVGKGTEVRIGDEQAFAIIGERINPTGRRRFAEEICGGDMTTVQAEAVA
jgi:5-methyltetrahydrofolate--homocysteine methyltransferase